MEFWGIDLHFKNCNNKLFILITEFLGAWALILVWGLEGKGAKGEALYCPSHSSGKHKDRKDSSQC